jgi:hypothetical protein
LPWHFRGQVGHSCNPEANPNDNSLGSGIVRSTHFLPDLANRCITMSAGSNGARRLVTFNGKSTQQTAMEKLSLTTVLQLSHATAFADRA